MKPYERWSLHILTLLVTVSGVFYFVSRYLLTSDDPFAVINHPWEPALLNLHLVSSPALLFVFGLILNGHILSKIRNGTRTGRKSGWLCLASFGVMGASGYLLQVASGGWLWQVLLILHLSSGVIFSGGYVVHLVIGLRRKKSFKHSHHPERIAA